MQTLRLTHSQHSDLIDEHILTATELVRGDITSREDEWLLDKLNASKLFNTAVATIAIHNYRTAFATESQYNNPEPSATPKSYWPLILRLQESVNFWLCKYEEVDGGGV